jgi:hypothetical protein
MPKFGRGDSFVESKPAVSLPPVAPAKPVQHAQPAYSYQPQQQQPQPFKVRPSSFELDLDDEPRRAPVPVAPVAAQPIRKVASRENVTLNDSFFKAVPKSQYTFSDQMGHKSSVLPDIKPSGSHYQANTRYMPIDIAMPAASVFAPKPPQPKAYLDDFPSSYKPSAAAQMELPAINRGIKANEVNRRTDWAAKYGSK